MTTTPSRTPKQKRYYTLLAIFIIVVLILLPLWYSIDFGKDVEANDNTNPTEQTQ